MANTQLARTVLPPELFRQVEAYAKEHGGTVSGVIRRAVEFYFANKSNSSCHQMARGHN